MNDGIAIRLRARRARTDDAELLEIIDELLETIEELETQPGPPPSPRPVAAIRLYTLRNGEHDMGIQLSVTGNGATIGILEEDAKGNVEGTNVGVPTFTSADPTLLTVTPDPADPFKAQILPVGPAGASVAVAAEVDVTNPDGTITPFKGSESYDLVAGPVAQIAVQTTVNP